MAELPPKIVSVTGPVQPGRTIQVAQESFNAADSKSYYFNMEADAVLVSLWIGAIAGSINVTIWTLTELGKEFLIGTFPTVSAPTANIILKKGANIMSKVRIAVTFTDAVEYEIYARGVAAAEANVRVLGSDAATATQVTVTVVPTVVIPAALVDRTGLILKNYNGLGGGPIFLGFTAVEANATTGYPIDARESLGMDLASGVAVWAISPSGNSDIRILQAGA